MNNLKELMNAKKAEAQKLAEDHRQQVPPPSQPPQQPPEPQQQEGEYTQPTQQFEFAAGQTHPMQAHPLLALANVTRMLGTGFGFEEVSDSTVRLCGVLPRNAKLNMQQMNELASIIGLIPGADVNTLTFSTEQGPLSFSVDVSIA